jgi:membrane fusion protein, macrolide-specific efflux system
MKKLIAIIITGLAGCSLLLAGCNSGQNAAAAQPEKTTTVKRGNLTTSITAAGNLALSQTEDLAFEVAGTVVEVNVSVGDAVKKGDVLARLDASEQENQLLTLSNNVISQERSLLQAQINLKNLEISLEEAEAPTATSSSGSLLLKTTNTQQIEILRLQVELAEARAVDAQQALDEARSNLQTARDASLEIIAPYDGFIPRINAKGGDAVKKGSVAMQIADPDRFEASILVSEIDISQVSLTGEAEVEVDALSALSLPARVTYISPTATVSSGVVNYGVTVALEPLTAAGTDQLRSGMTVTVSIIIANRQNVLLVPSTAVTSQGGQSYVRAVTATGAVEQRAVQTGLSDYQYTEITQGLSEGEIVVTSTASNTAPATTAATQQQPSGGMMIPGLDSGGGGAPPAGGP